MTATLSSLPLLPQSLSTPNTANKNKVLNEYLIGRLAILNQSTRLLRAMGYRILRQELSSLHETRPVLEIACESKHSIAPLLKCSKQRLWHTQNGKKRCYAEFNHITISWEEV